jgi:biopolymer transport protein ExbD
MGAKVGGSSGGGMDEINVTPLIDVVLVLLIIFMVLTPITISKMATELPPEDQDEPPPPPDPNDQPLMVAIYADNSLALNLIPTDETKLRADLTARLKGKAKAKRNVFVDAHPDALYDTVVHAVDLARDCGAERVGFADMKEEGPLQATPEQIQIMQSGGAAAPPATAPAP